MLVRSKGPERERERESEPLLKRSWCQRRVGHQEVRKNEADDKELTEKSTRFSMITTGEKQQRRKTHTA